MHFSSFFETSNFDSEETSSYINNEEAMDDNDEINEVTKNTHNLFYEETSVALKRHF